MLDATPATVGRWAAKLTISKAKDGPLESFDSGSEKNSRKTNMDIPKIPKMMVWKRQLPMLDFWGVMAVQVKCWQASHDQC